MFYTARRNKGTLADDDALDTLADIVAAIIDVLISASECTP